MKALVIHDVFGRINSIAIPGQKLPFGELRPQPKADQCISEINIPDMRLGEGLPGALRKLYDTFVVVPARAELVRKQRDARKRKKR